MENSTPVSYCLMLHCLIRNDPDGGLTSVFVFIYVMMIIRTHKQQEICLRSLGLVGGSEGCQTFWVAIPTSRRHGVIHPVAKGETVIATANDKSCCQEERERERATVDVNDNSCSQETRENREIKQLEPSSQLLISSCGKEIPSSTTSSSSAVFHSQYTSGKNELFSRVKEEKQAQVDHSALCVLIHKSRCVCSVNVSADWVSSRQ